MFLLGRYGCGYKPAAAAPAVAMAVAVVAALLQCLSPLLLLHSQDT